MNENLIPLSWEDVRDDFHRLNKELAEVIDDLNPPKSFRLYKAKYCFGSEYLKYGKLQLPGPGKTLIPLTSPDVPKQVFDDLSYNIGSNPVCFVIDKTFEVYMPHSYRPTPVPFMQAGPGNLFSTSGILQSVIQKHQAHYLWNISAGARSIFMLPKISKSKNYRNLQRTYGHSIQAPNSILDHWELFKNLYVHDLLGDWQLQQIFFSKQWFEKLDTPKFAKFKLYLQQDLYGRLSYWSTQQFWNNYFSMINNMTCIKPDSYVYDTVRHLFLISMGVLSGMAPATNENSAPILAIQQLFEQEYKLEKYIPIVMELTRFNPYEACNPVYYSLNYANAHELSARSNDHTSTIQELYEIKSLLSLYSRKIKETEINITGTVLSDIPDIVAFDFFHNMPKNYKDINDSKEIFLNDQLMAKKLNQKKPPPELEHPFSAPFVSGCIRISNKKTS